MKKSQLWKQILTGSLVLALTVTNVTPVMAAEIQPEGKVALPQRMLDPAICRTRHQRQTTWSQRQMYKFQSKKQ